MAILSTDTFKLFNPCDPCCTDIIEDGTSRPCTCCLDMTISGTSACADCGNPDGGIDRSVVGAAYHACLQHYPVSLSLCSETGPKKAPYYLGSVQLDFVDDVEWTDGTQHWDRVYTLTIGGTYSQGTYVPNTAIAIWESDVIEDPEGTCYDMLEGVTFNNTYSECYPNFGVNYSGSTITVVSHVPADTVGYRDCGAWACECEDSHYDFVNGIYSYPADGTVEFSFTPKWGMQPWVPSGKHKVFPKKWYEPAGDPRCFWIYLTYQFEPEWKHIASSIHWEYWLSVRVVDFQNTRVYANVFWEFLATAPGSDPNSDDFSREDFGWTCGCCWQVDPPWGEYCPNGGWLNLQGTYSASDWGYCPTNTGDVMSLCAESVPPWVATCEVNF